VPLAVLSGAQTDAAGGKDRLSRGAGRRAIPDYKAARSGYAWACDPIRWRAPSEFNADPRTGPAHGAALVDVPAFVDASEHGLVGHNRARARAP
jgi:hypothetical protein